MKDKLIIVGTGAIAEVIFDYLNRAGYDITCFAVYKDHIEDDLFMGKPVVPFETIDLSHPPDVYKMHIAVGYVKLNHLRAKFYREAKEKGYRLISYIDPAAYVHANVEMGDNCFIFENNVVQYGVKLRNNVLLWSGNHIGHGTILRSHVYVASHVVISGNCDIGRYSFIGVNATFADGVTIGENCLISMGARVHKNMESNLICAPPKSNYLDINLLSGKNRDMFFPEEV